MGQKTWVVGALVGGIVVTAAALYAIVPSPSPSAGRVLEQSKGGAKAGWTKLPPRSQQELPGDLRPGGPAGSAKAASSSPNTGQGTAKSVGSASSRPGGGPADAPPNAPDGPKTPRPVFAPDPTGIKNAVNDVRGDLRDCYEAWLEMNPGLGGRMVVEFSIAVPEDKAATLAEVKDVQLADSGIEHPMLEGCALNVMSGLQFEIPDDDVRVAYPFTFASTDGGVIDAGASVGK